MTTNDEIRLAELTGQVAALKHLFAALLAQYAMDRDPDTAEALVEQVVAIMPPGSANETSPKIQALQAGFLKVLNDVELSAGQRVVI